MMVLFLKRSNMRNHENMRIKRIKTLYELHALEVKNIKPREHENTREK